ncbi:MAG: tetratricopeptide repeat protein [Pseudomonadota bacterium]|nr:tetratricopeptide repeat protein [Pseudomonadota bacterium]
MPAFPFRFSSGRVSAIALAMFTFATNAAFAAAPVATEPEVTSSKLDAPLFYQLLLGEIELRNGDTATAYQLLLDAARRANDEALFRRVTDIALQARAGDQALAAVQAWRKALPASQEALRYQVQLLVALNRVGEAEEPLGALLKQAPRPSLPAMIDALPRFLGRSTDRNAVAALIDRSMKPFAADPETRTSALVASGRGWLFAGDTAKALDYAQRAAAADPVADGPALLALDLLPATPAAEAIVTTRIATPPSSSAVRLLYIRTLAAGQRLADAAQQAVTLTQAEPTLAPPWLTLGALDIELHRPKDATVALETYVRLVEGGAPVTFGGPAAPNTAPADDDDDTPSTSTGALTQAWLLLSQAAEEQGDLPGAESWLAHIDSSQRALEVQSRRASLLAKQGKMTEARELIRRVPERTKADTRAKLLAEAELLRDAKQWSEAEKVLAQANLAFPDDTDLLYEQAMIDEKLDRLDDMERLLRRVIELKPNHQHAYNALGYSLADRKMRLPEARALIQKALELSPGEPFITDSLGWVEYRLGHREEAIRLLRVAYQARPDPEIAAHLGEVLWYDGKTDEARKIWREGRSRDSANDVLRETLARLRVDL